MFHCAAIEYKFVLSLRENSVVVFFFFFAHVMEEGSPVAWQTAGTTSRLSHGEETEADLDAERLAVSEDTMGWFYTTSDLRLSVLGQLECGLVLHLGWRLPERRRTSSMRSGRTWIRRRDEPGAGVYVCRRESLPRLRFLYLSPSVIHSLIT